MEWPDDPRVVVPELLARGDPEHLADQVDPGDLLGDAVLHLEAGVHLEEGDGPVLGDEELTGAGADVVRLAQDRLGALVEAAHLVVGQERRGRLLDQLLVAPLQRAVTGGDHHDVAVLVGEALGLDVARLVEELLHEALAASEGGLGLTHRRLEGVGDLLLLASDLEAATATSERGLDRDRQAVLLGELRRPRRRPRAGPWCRRASGAPTFSAMWRALTLSPRFSIASGGGPIQTSPASITAWAKSRFSARKP